MFLVILCMIHQVHIFLKGKKDWFYYLLSICNNVLRLVHYFSLSVDTINAAFKSSKVPA